MEYEVAVWVGRVQPYHLGHLKVLQRSLETIDKPHVNGIVSHAYEHLRSEPDGKNARRYNPFTPEERCTMVRTCLVALGLADRVTTIVIPFLDMSSWRETAFYLPRRFMMCTTNKDAEDLAKVDAWDSFGWRSTVIDVTGFGIVSSSDFRQAMLVGQDWRLFMHESVHDYFVSIDGPVRFLRSALDVSRYNTP